ncbi:hypothetical protein LWI29_038195 [Acer saccharum]|uniref:Disease resistance R13L4/SHOC-2-like LRR domain-containing protein n=1 Tax=Acer saccharum TaxID=4024 RepID=A0AA39SR75_ACESA|nr:hypothetical protein LWI29_038195 [Acer saccharum]
MYLIREKVTEKLSHLLADSPNNSAASLNSSQTENPQDFPKLKTIKLRNSHNLIETPDFTTVPNLEMLDLKGCTRLCKVHESIGVLKSLIELNLEGCNNLRSFPSNAFFGLKSLKILNLQGCSKLDKFPENMEELEHLEELDVGGTAITQVPSSIARLTNLQKLSFQKCNSLRPWWSSCLSGPNTRCLVLPSLAVHDLPPDYLSCLRMAKKVNISVFAFALDSFTTFESDHLWLAYVSREQFEHERSLTSESSRRWEYEYDSINYVLNQGTSGTDRTVSGRETTGGLLGADKVNLNEKSDKWVSNSNSTLNLNDDSGQNFGVRSFSGDKFSGKEKDSVVVGKEGRCVEVDAGSSNASDVGPSPSPVFVFRADGVTKKAIGPGDFNVPQSNNGPFVGPNGLENISFDLVDGKSSRKSVFDPITETIDPAGAEHKFRKKSGTKSTNGKKGGTVEEECTTLQWGRKGVSSRSALWEKEGGGGF